MKSNYHWTIVVLIIIGLCSCNILYEITGDQPEQVENEFMLENANKLGPTLKIGLLDESLESSGTLNLLVQVSNESIDTIREQLSNLNAEIRTVAGDVLTVSLPAEQLENLAGLDFVVYIELSSPLSLED